MPIFRRFVAQQVQEMTLRKLVTLVETEFEGKENTIK